MANPLIALLGVYALVASQDYGRMPPAPTERAPDAPKGVSKQRPIALIAAVPGRGIQDVPNIAIKYYDVTGKKFADVVRSIGKQRPKDPATGQFLAGGSGWTLGASLTKVTTGGKCDVTAAKAEFSPTAELPRLVNEQALAPDQLASWRAYLSQIEAPAAAGLWFIQDRLAAFEKSLIGKPCDVALQAGAAAIAQLRADQAEFQRQYNVAHGVAAPPPASPASPATPNN